MSAAGSGPGPVDHLAALRTEGDRLVTAVRAADLDAGVPGLTWDVRTVATHTGAVHRWSADVVRRGLATNETGGSVAFWPDGLADADVAGWPGRGSRRAHVGLGGRGRGPRVLHVRRRDRAADVLAPSAGARDRGAPG